MSINPLSYARQLYRKVVPATLHVPVDWVPLEFPSDGPIVLDKPLRGIRANTPGTVTVVTASGEERVMNFAQGETRYCVITSIVEAEATGLEGAV